MCAAYTFTAVSGGVAEHHWPSQARPGGQAEWAREVLDRPRAGEYWFDGEPDPPWRGVADTRAG
jgi:hypothetical protein